MNLILSLGIPVAGSPCKSFASRLILDLKIKYQLRCLGGKWESITNQHFFLVCLEWTQWMDGAQAWRRHTSMTTKPKHDDILWNRGTLLSRNSKSLTRCTYGVKT